MALIPKIKITNLQDKSLIEYRDVTGYFGITNINGFGGPNPNYTNITSATVKINEDPVITLLYNLPANSISDLFYVKEGSINDGVYKVVYTLNIGSNTSNVYIYDELLKNYYKITLLVGEILRTEYPLTTKSKYIISAYNDLEIVLNSMIEFASIDSKDNFNELYDAANRICKSISNTLEG
jgi:hypothetical protein